LEHTFDLKGDVKAALEFWKAEYRQNSVGWEDLPEETLTRAFQKNGCKNAPIQFWASEYAVHRNDRSRNQLSSSFKAKGNLEEEIDFWKEDILANPHNSYPSRLLLLQASKRGGDLDVIIGVWKPVLRDSHVLYEPVVDFLKQALRAKGDLDFSIEFWKELGRARKAERGLRAALEYRKSQHRFEDDDGL
jgi:tetratricopeptide (TPR) repeat protein